MWQRIIKEPMLQQTLSLSLSLSLNDTMHVREYLCEREREREREGGEGGRCVRKSKVVSRSKRSIYLPTTTSSMCLLRLIFFTLSLSLSFCVMGVVCDLS